MTSARRSSPISQMTCVGSACRKFQADVIQCKNVGSDGYDVQWRCEADLPESYRLGSTTVNCEGYSSRDDPFVLRGSCGVEYELHEVGNRHNRHSRHQGHNYRKQSEDHYRPGAPRGSGLATFLILLLVAIVFIGAYKSLTKPEGGAIPDPPPDHSSSGGSRSSSHYGGDDSGGDNGSGGSGDRSDGRSDGRGSGSSSGGGGHYSGGTGCQQQQQQQQWRQAQPGGAGGFGFWQGMMGGGALGYLFGNRGRGYAGYPGGYGGYGGGYGYRQNYGAYNQGYHNNYAEEGPRYRNGGGWSGWGNRGTTHTSTTSGGAMRTSTGYGGTTRR